MPFKPLFLSAPFLLLAAPLGAAPVSDEALCVGSFGVGALEAGDCLPLKGKKRKVKPGRLRDAVAEGVPHLKIHAKDRGVALELAPLAAADQVHTLVIDRQGPIDLTPLGEMKNLRRLELKGDAALALSQLTEEMPALAELTISASGRPVDLGALAHMGNLRKLTLRAGSVTGQAGLGGLTRLERALFHLGEDTDLASLAGAVYLQRLEISGSMGRPGVSDLGFAAALTGLTHLELGSNAVADLRPLAGLTGLVYLGVIDNPVLSDVTPLAGLVGLETLRLQGSSVADVTPLAGLTGLRRLDLSQTEVSDISPLDGLALKFLGLEGTAVSATQ